MALDSAEIDNLHHLIAHCTCVRFRLCDYQQTCLCPGHGIGIPLADGEEVEEQVSLRARTSIITPSAAATTTTVRRSSLPSFIFLSPVKWI